VRAVNEASTRYSNLNNRLPTQQSIQRAPSESTDGMELDASMLRQIVVHAHDAAVAERRVVSRADLGRGMARDWVFSCLRVGARRR
jgi:hypothetical protein